MKLTEMSLQEKDQKIGELDRFIQRMEQVSIHMEASLLIYMFKN